MPLVKSSYIAPRLFRNGHFSTIYSAKLRPSPTLVQQRERIDLPDGDFLDIDWSYASSTASKVAVLLHGLEGNAQRTYMKGQARMLVKHQWDVVAMNYRGCSGEPNLLYPSYNAGTTQDLHVILQHILALDRYDEIALIGFSLGGNLMLKYLGERDTLPKQLKKGVAISTPLSLEGSLESLSQFYNWVYRTSFLYNLKKKYKTKMLQFPERMTSSELKKIKSLLDFDNLYTAPAHGFEDAYEYYQKNSSLQFLPKITIPVLLLNAKNDTFLSPDCYPTAIANNNGNIYLESPEHGGHVGFHQTNDAYYSENRALQFLQEN
ncbi:MAG: alpha/beta fold hydrolase [Altibacter sp.]|uniref:YheT family hydrolase n=1 Tax=Altibacter lentus TaxID=1223410 RepID=UPI00055567A8|nr:alpha/beta fold hydrolase [Altibacter lentus]MCW8981059.1 alpha/beta fold hydrolase [Altibacter sp.]